LCVYFAHGLCGVCILRAYVSIIIRQVLCVGVCSHSTFTFVLFLVLVTLCCFTLVWLLCDLTMWIGDYSVGVV